MDDDTNNQNDQPTEEQQPSDETQTELREISKEELKQIYEKHQKWLESDFKEGEHADLCGANLKNAKLREANLQMALLYEANLQKADLSAANLQEAWLGNSNLQEANLTGVNLQNADLREANLQKADLSAADLQEADLRFAILQNADLTGANLQRTKLYKADMQDIILDGIRSLSEADLRYANLEGATGLLGNEFAQADVTGTKLPEDIKEFKALETVKETSQNARKIFFAMILGCVYSWLTIATTTDVRLLTNTASSPLPIIGTEIPIAGFYIAAPLVLISLFLYFHFYLQGLWESLAGLPAIFPDGKRLDERAYPWLLNRLVRKHFKRLRPIRPVMAHLQEYVVIFLAWWVVPITMMAFWLRYIPRHDWVGTIFHIGLIVISVAFAIIFYRLCALTLQGKERAVFRLTKFWSDRRFFYGVSVALVAVLFSLVSYGAINGIILRANEKLNYFSLRQLVPWAFKNVGYDVFADFSEKDVSEKPDNYWEIDKEERLESVKGANLKGRNLTNADMYVAFLAKVDLRGANAYRADLEEANLQQAMLGGANLQQASLWRANLQKAVLRFTNLQQANLNGVNLQQADLGMANLQKAELLNANLQEAYLVKANLQEADLSRAILRKADIGGAKLQQTKLWRANLQQAKFVLSNLEEANLSEANLQKASLVDTNLQKANLKNANLQKAEFIGADLTGAKNLTIEQLSKVKTLYKTKLDPELLEQVKKCCPHLLEKPKEETE